MNRHPTTLWLRGATAAVMATLALSGLSACYYLPQPPSPSTTTTTAPTVPAGERAASSARSQIGTPYVYGGRTPGVGFDCSGLTSWSWEQAGTMIVRTSRDQYRTTQRVTRAELLPGDLVFYAADGVTVSHVAMYVGDDRIVHARNSTTGVTQDQLSTYWTSARVGYGRVTPTIP